MLDDAVKEIKQQCRRIDDAAQRLQETGVDIASESFGRLERRLRDESRELRRLIEEVIRYPPHHIRHFDHRSAFGDPALNVFIMTKYPDASEANDTQLQKVINVTVQAIRDGGFIPRLASDARNHPLLWDNIESYLLYCDQAIAIVEDCHTEELNPNVAMEWGWMRAMGRPVLFLKEVSFSQLRADWEGLVSDTFDWNAPEVRIRPAVVRWLNEIVESRAT